MMANLLEATGIRARYGSTAVLHGIDFIVAEGGVTAILGANGAGKTTTLRAVSGLVRMSGAILLGDTPIAGLRPEAVAGLGVAHVPDGRGTFTNLTVEENLELGGYTLKRGVELRAQIERMFTLFPVLSERRRQQAGTLSGGEQQMLAIGRALMMRPRLLLLDEPSFGLAPLIVQDIFAIMRRIKASENVSILLVEQNATLALDIADHAYVLETGRIVLGGPAQQVRGNPAVQKSYLGYQ
jgi:branched-chain amino acid transport system ATP-binding protein